MRKLPLRRVGDRVRVIQADEMVLRGIANYVGPVVLHQLTPSHMVRIALDDEGDGSATYIDVPAMFLRRVYRKK